MSQAPTAAPALLPPGFAALERFVAYWDVATSHERWQRRAEASMAEIAEFYHATLALADPALAHIEQFPLDELPEDAARLLRLLLAMTQAGVAVEIHDQPRAPYSPYPHGLRIVSGMSPFG